VSTCPLQWLEFEVNEVYNSATLELLIVDNIYMEMKVKMDPSSIKIYIFVDLILVIKKKSYANHSVLMSVNIQINIIGSVEVNRVTYMYMYL
jgi:hypothetical protein